MSEEKRILADELSINEYEWVTMEEGKDFLYRLWSGANYHEEEWESEEQYDDFIDSIFKIDDWNELEERLGGCGYTILSNIMTLEEWKGS